MIDRDYLHHIDYFYNRFARFYDLGEFVRRGTRQAVVTISGYKPGDLVLDVCTGTGEQALTFTKNGDRVVGIDIVRGVLLIAKIKSTETKPEWFEMDASNLSFRDKSFDIATLSLALHHMLESFQLLVLRELVRVTRRTIVIVELHTPTNPKLWSMWTFFASIFDQSEHMHDWAKQDFSSTCRKAGLRIDDQIVMTHGIHRVTKCVPF
jgi:demethylmenaquinone methyltransferase/2-methoxy-6-polyprenyl-1,4-benzoquinol methylase